MRRLMTWMLVAGATALGFLWWLSDGDLRQAAGVVAPRWDADALAEQHGFPRLLRAREPGPEPAEEEPDPEAPAGEAVAPEGAPPR